MPSRLLLDTCVWLDLAKDYREFALLQVLIDLQKQKHIELIVPTLVVEEFDRNKERVVTEVSKSLSTHFRVIKQAYKRYEGTGRDTDFTTGLNELDFQITKTGDVASTLIKRVEEFLKSGTLVEVTQEAKLRAIDRALGKKAPFHLAKNSTGDAILLEIYSDEAAKATLENPCAFITLNTKDFSTVHGDSRLPHPDLEQVFDSPKSTYWTSVRHFIQENFPDLLEEEEEFGEGYFQEARGLSEILEVENKFAMSVWYNRHLGRKYAIDEGRIEVVPKSKYNNHGKQILDEIWEGALAAAKKVEDDIGLENLGPWSDFEWGFLNGKLSAVRWILGEEWDMLDT